MTDLHPLWTRRARVVTGEGNPERLGWECDFKQIMFVLQKVAIEKANKACLSIFIAKRKINIVGHNCTVVPSVLFT